MRIGIPARTAIWAGLAMALAAVAAPAQAEVIARVDGVEITDQDAAIAEEDIGSTLPPQMSPAQRSQYIANYLVDLKLAARKAAAAKLDTGAEFERKMAYFREKAQMQALLDDLRLKAVTEAEVKRVYDEAAKAQTGEQEVKASHVLVETEAQAKAALKRVRGGEDFAKVAGELSKDPGSPGGALGWFTKDRMVPEFAEMAFNTPPGRISEPVKTRFGWHIIRVEDKRAKVFPPLADVRGQIEQFIVRRVHTEAISALRNQAKIENPSAAAPPLAPGAKP